MVRAWLRRVFRRDPADEVDEELRFHLERRIADYEARGLDAEAARRAAERRLGDLSGVRAECSELLARERRSEARREWLNVSWLDVRLGLRMMRKHPGLSVVSVIGMAVAIAIGAGFFGAISATMDTSLPLEEGGRIVALQVSRADRAGPERRILDEFDAWRGGLRSVRDVGAFRGDRRNLIVEGGGSELVPVAEMSAAGFRVARVPALLGRTLVESDEHAGAPPALVIAYEEWQRRFGGDPDIVGRTVRLGRTPHTVVGVMPAGFRFPVNHRYWIPLRLDPLDHEPGAGPAIEVFGRLVDGFTTAQAQAELSAISRHLAQVHPESHADRRPRVLPYTHPYFDIDSPAMAMAMHGLRMVISLLLVVIAANVGVLVYARTATRTGEIAVRSALGASRRRIVTQLFVEAFVLSLIAAAAGLAIAAAGLAFTHDLLVRATGDMFPFWVDFGLSPGVVAYVLGLSIVAAVIVGVAPALKATGPRVQAALQQHTARGSVPRLGGTWTVLIVGQVAVAVAILPYAAFAAGESISRGTAEPGYAADEVLRAWLSMEREEAPPAAVAEMYERAYAARFVDRTGDLLRRLEAEPAVAGVTFANSFPGYEGSARIEIEESGVGGEGEAVHVVRSNRVAIDLFDVLDVPIVSGRGFTEADRQPGENAVIVNEVFARRLSGGGAVLGRRIRHVSPAPAGTGEPMRRGPWLQIVGIVPDFSPPSNFEPAEPRIYESTAVAAPPATVLAVRVREGSASAFAQRLMAITASVDPTLQLHDLQTAAAAEQDAQRSLRFLAAGITAITLSVLLLSAAGIYAMMSFTVASRRREIGIRTALGADPRRVLGAIFARSGAQIGAGVLVGLLLAAAIEWGTGGRILGGTSMLLLPAVALFMAGIGLAAALGPARRGLAIQPTEALRAD